MALGVYTSLEWISQPIPVSFTNQKFHKNVFQIRKAQALKLMSLIDELRLHIADRDLNRELDLSVGLFNLDIANLDSTNHPWGTRVLLLNEALEAARERQLRYLVNTYDDTSISQSNQLIYILQAEDLYGFFFGLQILGTAQNLKIFELSDAFYFSFVDVWYLAESFKSIHRALLRRLQQMDPALVASSALGLETIAIALNSPHLQELYATLSKIENQWRTGNSQTLQFKPDSAEYKAILSQIKSMLKTSRNLSELLDEQLQVQRRNVQLSVQSCVDLLSRQY